MSEGHRVSSASSAGAVRDGRGKHPVFDSGQTPVADGAGPDRDEQGDDDVAGVVEVDAGDPPGDRVGCVQLVMEDADEFDRADAEGDGDGQRGEVRL